MSTNDPLAVFDAIGEFIATLAGMRTQLVADGWTDEQARDLIVAIWQTNAKGAAS